MESFKFTLSTYSILTKLINHKYDVPCDIQISIGDETLTKFSGVPLGEACSIVLRGATEQIIGEADRKI